MPANSLVPIGSRGPSSISGAFQLTINQLFELRTSSLLRFRFLSGFRHSLAETSQPFQGFPSVE